MDNLKVITFKYNINFVNYANSLKFNREYYNNNYLFYIQVN